MISFVCNICGQQNTVDVIEHEPSSCTRAGCRSNVRLRALLYLLSTELFGKGFLLSDFPALRAIKGLGLSDQASYAVQLAKKFDYTNTYYDREPFLDITQPHPDRYGSYDFILSTDVFEHITAPVDRAFEEAYKLLKPHGVMVMSVPFSLRENTDERFAGLHEFTVVDLAGTPVLINRTREGALEIRDDLVFHGGAGATLEMRLFSKSDLQRKLTAAGFQDLHFQTEGVPRFGIVFQGGWSLPMVARKQEFVFDRRAAGQLVAEYNTRTSELTEAQTQLTERGVWATGLQRELEEAGQNLAKLDAEFQERTQWALQLNTELEEARRTSTGLLAQLAESRWMKLGRLLGLGPKLDGK